METSQGSSQSLPSSASLAIATAAFSSAIVVQKLYRKYETRRKLRVMAEDAVQRRDEKMHKVLGIVSKTKSIDFYSAFETREGVFRGDISAVDNLIYLAKRCVLYGRKDGGAVNAITEEFYDEVRTTPISL